MPSKRQQIAIGAGVAAAGALLGVTTLNPRITDDIKTLKTLLSVGRQIKKNTDKGEFAIDIFEQQAARIPEKTFLVFEGRQYSYGLVNDMANKVANIAMTWNLKPNETVAIMFYNEPQLIWTYFGFLKAGLSTALINHNLASKPLIHSIKASQAKIIVIGEGNDLLEAICSVHDQLPNVPMYVQGRPQTELPVSFLSMDDVMLRTHPVQPSKVVRSAVTELSNAAFIYTSGTTGVPKPVIVNQTKLLMATKSLTLVGGKSDDVIYTVTPLYHVSAHMAVLTTMNYGATLVLRRKFSAKHYWEDVRNHGVTVIIHIGELLRYLINTSKSELDCVHNVRAALGNGLRPDVWREFQRRFKVPLIVEVFASTEGPSAFVNLTGKVGAVGRLSPFWKILIPRPSLIHLIKYGVIENKPIRDKAGKCIDIKPGEEGMMIAPLPPFYTGLYHGAPEQTEKKILRNVFEKDDAYFVYGDILYLDKGYYVYFRDRVGDTFRWKGENVSTQEVCNAMTPLDFIQDVNVYGVKVPNTEGRAGMAAILLKQTTDITSKHLKSIYQRCEKELPLYARPLFLRFPKQLALTQTMKHRKVELVQEGFDPSKTSDPLFVMDRERKTYVPLTTPSDYQAVINSRL